MSYFEAKVHFKTDSDKCSTDEPILLVTTLEDASGNVLVSNYILLINDAND